MEGHALHHRERDVREAGDAGHVGEPAGVPDAGVPHAQRRRRHAAQRAQRHHQPRAHHRSLPLRRIPRPLPRARHRLRRLAHRHVPSDPYRRRRQPPPAGMQRGRRVREGELVPAGGAVPVVRVPGAGLRGDPSLQHALRRGPVRPAHGVGQARHQQLLQLVLLHLHGGDAHLRDGDHLRAEQRELVHRPRHPHHPHVPCLRALLHGHAPVREGGPRGEPLHQRRAGVRGRRKEARAEAAQGPQAGPVRPAAHQRRRRQARAHGPVPMPRQGRHRRGRRAAWPGRDRGAGGRVEALQRAAGGGGQVPHPDRAGLVHGDHLLRRRRAAVHLRRALRAAVRQAPGKPRVPDPRSFIHGLRDARADGVDTDLRPPAAAEDTEDDWQGRGAHAAAADGHRHRALHGGHGHLGHRGGQAQGHRVQRANAGKDHDRRGHLGHVKPMDGAAAAHPGPLRGLQPHQPDRVLLQGDPRAHAERRGRARVLQPGARKLPQRIPRHHRAPDHGGRDQLAGAGPQPGTTRPLLLDHRRHRRLQLRLLHYLRKVVQVQGGTQLTDPLVTPSNHLLTSW